MITAIFMSLSIFGLYIFIGMRVTMWRVLYLKMSFDCAAIALLGLDRRENWGEVRVLVICTIVMGMALTFLYFVTHRQRDSKRG